MIAKHTDSKTRSNKIMIDGQLQQWPFAENRTEVSNTCSMQYIETFNTVNSTSRNVSVAKCGP